MNKVTLYQKNTSGKTKQWSVEVIDNGDHSVMHVESGQVGGKLAPHDTIIDKGKNEGKANETTPYTQAVLEAEAKIVS